MPESADPLTRRATAADIEAIAGLLLQVNEVHARLRPDLFRSQSRKYSPEQLQAIVSSAESPVFVAELEGKVCGHAFCQLQRHARDGGMRPHITLYIDDICVDAAAQRRGVASALFRHVADYARELGCHNLTLNVWEGNVAARRFYESMGLGVQKTGMEVILD